MKFLTKESFIESKRLCELTSEREFGEIERLTVEWLESSYNLAQAHIRQAEKRLNVELDFDDFIELDVSGVSFIDGVLTLLFDRGEIIFKGVHENGDTSRLDGGRLCGVEIFCEVDGLYLVNVIFEKSGEYISASIRCKGILTKISG